jgi:hypothetical protein
LLRPEALRALRGSEHIIHAGDIGDPEILARLAQIAPVTAVRGNNDTAAWARKIRKRETLELGGALVHVVHDVAELDVDPRAADFRAVISGHSHKPASELRDGVLFVNPGSAGPRRFSLPVSVAFLTISSRVSRPSLRARLVPLTIGA